MAAKFSVAMCVYGKDNSKYFREALQSVIEQTIIPNEIVLVVDGPIPADIKEVIDIFSKDIVFLRVIYLEQNKGYAYARQVALENCRNELIAIMDSDDICVDNRFELQLKAFEQHEDVSVVGGYITEFNGSLENVFGVRKTPLNPEECRAYTKTRAPINNVTAMYKKSHVIDIGGYKTDYFPEDYYMWIRLQVAGYKLINISDNLVYARIGDMFNRRGGLKYYKDIKKLYKYMLDNKFINYWEYLYALLVRFFVHVITPASFRRLVYKKFARK